MKKMIMAAFAILLLLCACAPKEEIPPTTVATEPALVDIGGLELEPEATRIDLTGLEFDVSMLADASEKLTQLSMIELGHTKLNVEQIELLQLAYPDAVIHYDIEFMGQVLETDCQYLDASGMTADLSGELLRIVNLLPMLREINFVSEDGICAFTAENIDCLDQIRESFPELYLRISLDLFGQTVTSEDERIEYYLVEIGNEGADVIRKVLPYLRSCTYLLMEGCGVDNEVMAGLRDDFPNTKVVWRVWLVEEDYNSKLFLRCGSFLTDTHRVRTTYINDENSHVLNYCTQTKYLDVGHVDKLTQCGFLAYMPELEVCIIALTNIQDIYPLENHEKLEYLELFTTPIADLSPLTTCPNIEHLNIGDMPNVTDISPLYGLTKLKRLRMIHTPQVPNEQKVHIEQLLTECQFLKDGDWPTGGLWRWADRIKGGRKVPRYELLCEQMEYAIDGSVYGIP